MRKIKNKNKINLKNLSIKKCIKKIWKNKNVSINQKIKNKRKIFI